MSVTSFSTDQCRILNTIVDEVMLPKYRMNRHTPKAVVYSPLYMGGLNYPSFEIIQDQQGFMMMLKHLRWNGTVAKDLLVVLSAIQLVSGLCSPIFEDVHTDLSFLGPGWLLHQRSRMAIPNITLWIERQWTPPLQRVGDQSLMFAFINIANATTKILEMAKYCRCYLRVITTADIADLNG